MRNWSWTARWSTSRSRKRRSRGRISSRRDPGFGNARRIHGEGGQIQGSLKGGGRWLPPFLVWRLARKDTDVVANLQTALPRRPGLGPDRVLCYGECRYGQVGIAVAGPEFSIRSTQEDARAKRQARGDKPIDYADLQRTLAGIDIYLFDQLMRGGIVPGMRVLDAGCGGGRNLAPLLRLGFEAFATDDDPRAVEAARGLAARIAPQLPAGNFRVEPVERCSFDDGAFDAVVSSAVLHFARGDEQFTAMVEEMWRVLRSGGVLFCRVASTIGMADRMRPLGGRRYRLPDGSERYLVDEPQLMALGERLGGMLVDPLKTTIVQDQRCMTTWVTRKKGE